MNALYRPDDRHHRDRSTSSRRERRANKRQLEKVIDKKLKEEIKAFLDKEGFEY